MIHDVDQARRRVLQVGTVGACGLTLPLALRAAEQAAASTATARSCILLYMDGGASHIDLLDLKPSAPAEVRGPWQPIDTSVPGVHIGELMPLTARQMHRVALVRSVCHADTVHDPAVYQMLTGYKHLSSAGGLKVEDTDLPHMATAFGAADRQPAVMPKVIELPETMRMQERILPGQNAGILGGTFDPFRVQVSPSAEVDSPQFRLQPDISFGRLGSRSSLLGRLNGELARLESAGTIEQFDRYQQQAIDILRSPQVERAFDLSREADSLRETYGRHRHGQSVLLARRLVEAGARFVTVYWGREDQDWADGKGARPANNPWDTHRNHFPLVKDSLVPRADQTLAALLEDLARRGLLDETLVVWMGDFGRTPRISKPWASRDHWPHAFSVLLGGGGIAGGLVHGATDRLAAAVTAAPVSPADVTATIFHALGISPQTVLNAAGGRTHRLSTGSPIREILG